jgi:hypothetical protein
MTIYFSKTANGFYNDAINQTIPDDKVAISEAVWQHLISNQSGTSQISADAEGNPILVDPSNANAVIYTSVGQT